MIHQLPIVFEILNLRTNEPTKFQIANFAYGLGAFIAPFIVEPFLLNKESDSDVVVLSETVTQSALLDNSSTTESASNSTGLKGSADDVMIHWPFIICAAYYLVVLFFFVLFCEFYPENTIHPSRTTSDDQDDELLKKDAFRLNKPLSNHLRIFVVVLATFAMHTYVGLEISFGSLLSPYAVYSKLQMTKSQGSFLTSSYWGTFTFLRVFGLIGTIYLSPRLLLLIHFVIIMASNAILLPFGNDYAWALWLGTGLIGFGLVKMLTQFMGRQYLNHSSSLIPRFPLFSCSGVFATIFAFLEQLTPVTARITAGFLIAGKLHSFDEVFHELEIQIHFKV